MFRSNKDKQPAAGFSIGGIGRMFRRLKRDERGVAALEFAWVAPAMLGLYMGSIELHYALSADRRVTDLASATADLVSQSSNVEGQMADIFESASAYLEPYGISGLKVTVTSICHDKNDQGKVDWSANHPNGGVNSYGHGQGVDLPADDGGAPALTEKGRSVVLAEVEYTYTSPFNVYVSTLNLSDKYYVMPRLNETPSVINTSDGGSEEGCSAPEFME